MRDSQGADLTQQLAVLATELHDLRASTHRLHETTASLQQMARRRALATALAEDRFADAKRLERHGFKVYSQSDEDGVIQEVFARIGKGGRRFVEIGCGGGLENNTAYLLHDGWSGAWIDADPANAERVHAEFESPLSSGQLSFAERVVTAENVEATLSGLGVPAGVDLLSIDVDGNDYHVWRAVRMILPRVVAIEYNAKFRPPLEWVMPYDPEYRWDGSDRHGASLSALAKLGERKGYVLVGCNVTGVNAFFVRAEEAADLFQEPFSAGNHYNELRLDLIGGAGSGHPARSFVPSAPLD